MNKTQIYNFLNSDRIYNNVDRENFLMELRKDLALETSSVSTRKGRQTKCFNIITKSKENKKHPTLQKYTKVNDLQFVTNAFIFAALKEEDYILGLKFAEEIDHYPNVSNLVKIHDYGKSCNHEVSVEELKILKKTKQEYIDIADARFSVEYLLNLTYLLNIDNQKTFMLNFDNPLRVAYVNTSNGSYGGIMPLLKS